MNVRIFHVYFEVNTTKSNYHSWDSLPCKHHTNKWEMKFVLAHILHTHYIRPTSRSILCAHYISQLHKMVVCCKKCNASLFLVFCECGWTLMTYIVGFRIENRKCYYAVFVYGHIQSKCGEQSDVTWYYVCSFCAMFLGDYLYSFCGLLWNILDNVCYDPVRRCRQTLYVQQDNLA